MATEKHWEHLPSGSAILFGNGIEGVVAQEETGEWRWCAYRDGGTESARGENLFKWAAIKAVEQALREVER